MTSEELEPLNRHTPYSGWCRRGVVGFPRVAHPTAGHSVGRSRSALSRPKGGTLRGRSPAGRTMVQKPVLGSWLPVPCCWIPLDRDLALNESCGRVDKSPRIELSSCHSSGLHTRKSASQYCEGDAPCPPGAA